MEEAREIAERGEMKLWLADYYLESARLARSEMHKEKMAEHCGQAKRLIEECGYHRRDGELEELASVSHKPPRAWRGFASLSRNQIRSTKSEIRDKFK